VAKCSPSVAGAAAIDLDKSRGTFLVENFGGLVLQEPVSGLLAHFGAEGVFGLLAFLEKFGDLFEAGIGLLFLLLGFLDVVQEETIGLVIDFLGRALGFDVHIAFKGINPINFLFRHSNLNYL
jgi:hypothetical protein